MLIALELVLRNSIRGPERALVCGEDLVDQNRTLRCWNARIGAAGRTVLVKAGSPVSGRAPGFRGGIRIDDHQRIALAVRQRIPIVAVRELLDVLAEAPSSVSRSPSFDRFPPTLPA